MICSSLDDTLHISQRQLLHRDLRDRGLLYLRGLPVGDVVCSLLETPLTSLWSAARWRRPSHLSASAPSSRAAVSWSFRSSRPPGRRCGLQLAEDALHIAVVCSSLETPFTSVGPAQSARAAGPRSSRSSRPPGRRCGLHLAGDALHIFWLEALHRKLRDHEFRGLPVGDVVCSSQETPFASFGFRPFIESCWTASFSIFAASR